MGSPVRTVEVFADVLCPFTHVTLLRFVQRRDAAGHDDVRLRVRAWPLEVVNGQPSDAELLAEEIEEIRAHAAGDLFGGFRADAVPRSSLPALAVTHAGYRVSTEVGEEVALTLRRLLFEFGVDIGDPEVLREVSTRHGFAVAEDDRGAVLADHAEGISRGVQGSPYFITGTGPFFCPGLDVGQDEHGKLKVTTDPEGFDRFLAACFD